MNKNDIKKCPNCKLINLPSEKTCECGYIFTTPDIDEQKSLFLTKCGGEPVSIRLFGELVA